MEYKNHISISTKAKAGEIYPIWLQGTNLIGEAEFLRKEGDLFVFEIQLLGKRQIGDFDFKFSVDAVTNELFSLRASQR